MTPRDEMWLVEIAAELGRARAAFPPLNSLHEGYAVILEELNEFWDEVKDKNRTNENLRSELIQTAAMCVRTLSDVLGSPRTRRDEAASDHEIDADVNGTDTEPPIIQFVKEETYGTNPPIEAMDMKLSNTVMGDTETTARVSLTKEAMQGMIAEVEDGGSVCIELNVIEPSELLDELAPCCKLAGRTSQLEKELAREQKINDELDARLTSAKAHASMLQSHRDRLVARITKLDATFLLRRHIEADQERQIHELESDKDRMQESVNRWAARWEAERARVTALTDELDRALKRT